MNKALIIVTAAAALMLQQSATAQTGEELFKSKGCAACHAVGMKLVGPAYKDVAAKYAGDAGAAQRLSTNIKNGTSGTWGPIPMPPNNVTEEEAKILAEWVLQQK
ncbi:MAG TPA: c-type cytochrome [Pseudomonas sp.]|nr:c-type cytochrome [Pseudomonas sp.]